MNGKDPLIFIEHILDNIKNIESFSKGISKEELEKNNLKQYAIIRAIEIVGEAVKNLPIEFKKKYSDVPWKKIAGTRDKIIHHYFGIDLNTVWDVIKEDIPPLKEKILKIKEQLKKLER